jgi:hypothetical protein
LARALRDHPAAKEQWEALPPSHRREYVAWLVDAKKETTLQRRLTQAVEKLQAGQKTPLRSNDAASVSSAPMEKKLGIKAGKTFSVIGAPDSYRGPGGRPPPPGGSDLVLAFARDLKDLARVAPLAFHAVHASGIVWFGFPKKTSPLHADLSRDSSWDLVEREGWETAGLIALDDDWSAFRFRRSEARR